MNKQEAISEIHRIISECELTREDLKEVFNDTPEKTRSHATTLSKAFAYFGGILFLSGIIAFVSMFWDDLGSLTRVTISLGSGFTMYVLALLACSEKRFNHVATVLVTIAGFLQPLGLFILLDEFFDIRLDLESNILVFGLLLIQQVFTFLAKQRTSFLFFAITYGSILTCSVGEYLHIDHEILLIALGGSLLWLAFKVQDTLHTPLACWLHFFGSTMVLYSVFDLLEGTHFEFLFFALNILIVFLSTIAKSRTLLATGTLSLFSYIAYFTLDNFVDSIGWPVALMILGLLFFGVSAIAMRIKQKYLVR